MNPGGALAALLERDLRAIVRSRSQLYSSLLTPLLFFVFLGTGVSSGLDPAGLSDGGFTSYLLAGTVVMTSVFSSTFSSASYYRDRDSGVLRVLLASPQPPRLVFFGKALSGVVVGSLQSIVVLTVVAPFVDLSWQWGILAGAVGAAAVVLLLNVMLGGFAQMLCTRIETMQGFHLVMNLALFPLLFFSGAFFPIDDLPVWLKVLAWANPLTYAVDGLLQTTYASSSSGYLGLREGSPGLPASRGPASSRIPSCRLAGARRTVRCCTSRALPGR